VYRRASIIALAGVTVVLALVHVAGISAIARDASANSSYLLLQYGFGIFAISAAVLGIVIAANTPTGSGQLLVALSFVMMGLPVLEDGLASFARTRGDSEILAKVASLYTRIALFIVLAAALRFSQLFPSPLRKDSIRDAANVQFRMARAVLEPLGWVQRVFLNHYLLWGTTAVVVVLALAGPLVVTPALSGAATICVAILILANLRAAHVAASPEQRRSVYWLSLGMIVVVMTGFLTASLVVLEFTSGWRIPIALWPYWLGLAGLLGGLCVTAFAILYQGALDPVLMIHKTLLYGGLAVVLVFLFSGLENVLTNYVVNYLGLPSGFGAWIAGGMVALILGPMQEAMARRVRAREVNREGTREESTLE
jgi:hypothetical protein